MPGIFLAPFFACRKKPLWAPAGVQNPDISTHASCSLQLFRRPAERGGSKTAAEGTGGPAGRPTGDGSGPALNGYTVGMSGNRAPISQSQLRVSQNDRSPSLRPHLHGVAVGNAERGNLHLSKRLKTRLSKHVRAASFEPPKAGHLSQQTLNLSEEMSGVIFHKKHRYVVTRYL